MFLVYFFGTFLWYHVPEEYIKQITSASFQAELIERDTNHVTTKGQGHAQGHAQGFFTIL